MQELGPEATQALEKMLGYLNFSSGTRDRRFFEGFNLVLEELAANSNVPNANLPTESVELAGDVDTGDDKIGDDKIGDDASGTAVAGDEASSPKDDSTPAASAPQDDPNDSKQGSKPDVALPFQQIPEVLEHYLEKLDGTQPAFQDVQQAKAVINLAYRKLPEYFLSFHRDLLFHQPPEEIFNAFFLALLAEATLKQGGPWDEEERILKGATRELNDFVGYRPIPTLEGVEVGLQPHERIRPVPLFIRDVGVVFGRHREIVEQALELLRQTPANICQMAQFDLEMLDELAFDPRAYDFDHPVNKRPNYHFGLWDPHCIDQRGNFRRYVIQQVTLDALTSRVETETELSLPERQFEAAAVLAGTILMGAGVSGSGPTAYGSDVTLTALLPVIASYRDQFYQFLFTKLTGEHAVRLKQEAVERRQPFGGARQHLNAQLARVRASQLEHVHLAMIFGRMGYPNSALKQSQVVPVASARMICRIDCELDASHQAIAAGDLKTAATNLPKIRELLRRGIECGAIADPWNILGFDGNFSLFPAIENSVRDHRVDDLVALVEQIFALYSRLWSEAAATSEPELSEQVKNEFHDFALWWQQFAAHEVQAVEAVDAMVLFRAAEHVADALALWHKAGASSGDLAFWAEHADLFDSPKAYALVVDALIQRGDDVASMAILIHWLSRADEVGLEEGDSSYQYLCERWTADQFQALLKEDLEIEKADGISQRIAKLFDYLEANAGDFWQVPMFELRNKSPQIQKDEQEEDSEEEPEEDSLFGAAYEDVVYRDSTDDGQEGAIFDPDQYGNDELEIVTDSISERLEFIGTLATLWKMAAGITVSYTRSSRVGEPDGAVSSGDELLDENTQAKQGKRGLNQSILESWIKLASQNRADLVQLLDDVRRYPLSNPSGDHDSMVEYDRQRLAKESLLDRIINTIVAYDEATRWLVSASLALSGDDVDKYLIGPLANESVLLQIVAAAFRRDQATVKSLVPQLINDFKDAPLLYVPMAKGGNPHEIVSARGKQQAIIELLVCLPKMGLLKETRLLLETAREMERANPVGLGAVTEFDEIFKIGYTSLVEALIESSRTWSEPKPVEGTTDPAFQSRLFDVVEQLTENMLATWLAHSRTLRLSVLEKVSDGPAWEQVVEFIKRYGEDLFTQKFFNLGNLRAILHQGVEAWLEQLVNDPADYDLRLLDELDGRLKRNHAINMLTLILESIIENYSEYRDYNSTTTQSDQGELLYMLLDFLRIRTQYDRVAWHLRPVVWSHATLVRAGEKKAARLWRRALIERLGEEPDKYLKRLQDLQKQYAMRMPTVADRLGERFIQPLQIDRIRALVEPAMTDPTDSQSIRTFELLEHEVELLTREPSGVGLDIPPWLAALEEEVEHARARIQNAELDIWGVVKAIPISFEEAKLQLEKMQQDAEGDVQAD